MVFIILIPALITESFSVEYHKVAVIITITITLLPLRY